MAGFFLTASATLLCPHGGTVAIVPASNRALAGGSVIATTADTFTIAGCTFILPGPVPSPCVRVQWIVPEMRVQHGGAPALDVSSTGLCLAATGAPQGPVSIQPAQNTAMGS
jgi:hypothetical protein